MLLKNYPGEKVGKLTIVRRAPGAVTRWVCVCDCAPADEFNVLAQSMVKGKRSCGCDVVPHAFRHGGSKTAEYRSWNHMKRRCYGPSNPAYPRYGGRGITVCDRWRTDFAAFLTDMGPRPTDGHSIDRIDNDGNYEPGNCRWATDFEQARNTRANVPVPGIATSIAGAAELTGLDQDMLRARVNRGLSPEQIVSPQSMEPQRLIEGPDGTTLRLNEWARRTGIAASTILWRIDHGWSPSLAATTPKTHRFRPARIKRAV